MHPSSHLNTDFLLALLRAVSLQRPSFRLILMSATINTQAYSAYYGGAPIIQARLVSGYRLWQQMMKTGG